MVRYLLAKSGLIWGFSQLHSIRNQRNESKTVKKTAFFLLLCPKTCQKRSYSRAKAAADTPPLEFFRN
ncbi:MAG: hypothetical protein A2V45_00250 [Candidatus Aminicenantes bacterium RBG_19FT_COMBO_58_17]|nr:MAG: hypothetical protein A2V45_00250 [Candidatus Aminicenantes bacterium RBG_19FT_COMBO_58_17]HCS47331.1 hypothetical protein [Candidatus Aminicenantes bacterium]